MPTFPFILPVSAEAGSLPAETLDDINSHLPAELKINDPAPVRDSLFSSLLACLQQYQLLSAYAAAQSNPVYATGEYLEGLAQDRTVLKAPGESDLSLSGRLFAPVACVTPQAIIGAANTILANAAASNISCEYLESALDRIFVFDGTQPATLHSFIGPVSPQYTDRFYKDDAALNGGSYVPGRAPGGAWCFGDEYGRMLVLRSPVLVHANSEHTFTFDSWQAVTHMYGSGPSITISGTPPLNTPTAIVLFCVGTGSETVATFQFSVDDVVIGVVTANTVPVSLGSTGYSATFSVGTYTALSDLYKITLSTPNPDPFQQSAGGPFSLAKAGGSFIADGTNTGGAEANGTDITFTYQNTATDLVLYQTICDTVNAIKGHSIRFEFLADPNLTY